MVKPMGAGGSAQTVQGPRLKRPRDHSVLLGNPHPWQEPTILSLSQAFEEHMALVSGTDERHGTGKGCLQELVSTLMLNSTV